MKNMVVTRITCWRWYEICLPPLAAVKEEFGEANVTVDWFHVVQLFTRAVDDVRKQEQ